MAISDGFTLGERLKVVGQIRGNEPLNIFGTVEGEISLEAPLSVEAGAVVIADISATELTIAGQVEGNIQVSGKVFLLAGSRVIGNLRVGKLAIEDGAAFKGQIEMDFGSE